MKNLLNSVMLFLLLFIGQNAWGQGDATLTEIESGSLSSTVQWTLYYRDGDEWDRHLSITGTGAIPDYTSITDRPWDSSRQDLNSISIADGITRIGNNAFYGVATYSIDIPSSVTSIGARAFYDSALKEIHIPSSVTSIGTGAFDNCDLLSLIHYEGRCTSSTGITFTKVAKNGFFFEKSGSGTSYAQVPSGWEYNTHNGSGAIAYISKGTLYVKGYGEYTSTMYSNNTDFTKIVVEEGVTNIGSSAFSGCANVTEATLNNNGTIGDYAFKNCTALTHVNIGTGLTSFWSSNYYPFYGCSSLSEVNVADLASFLKIVSIRHLTDSNYGTAKEKTLMVNGVTHSSSSELVIPEGVTEISNDAFRYFKNVTKIKFPSTMTKIAGYNFEDHTYLTQITLPSSVTSVGESAFSGCTALTTVTLNNSGTIGDYAFKNCTALTRVNIGTGLTGFWSSYYYPFYGCSKLSNINVVDLASFNNISGLEYLTDSQYGTAEKKTLMINGKGVWGDEILYLPEEMTSYNNSALRYFSNVQRISLPSTMTTVSGFNDHSYLTHVTLSSKVESVTKNAFANCSNLKRIVCLATTCPSTTGSIATEPSSITLKVPYGTASLYKAADVWKEFNVEGGKQYVYDIDIDVLQSVKLSNLHSILTTQKALSWNSSNTAVATVNDGVVTGTNFVYDGSTLQPAKYVKITAELEEGDYYFCGVHVTPKEVALTDGNAYRLATDLEAEKVSYTRSFSSNVKGHWQCFYVPFDIEITDELLDEFEFAKLYMVSYYDSNGNGVIEDGEPLKMILSRFSAGTILHANKPYYVKPKNACTKTFESTNVVLKAAANGSVRCCTTEHEYTLVGINETTNIKGMYSMNTKGQFVYCTSDANIKANRWYMEVKSLTEDGAVYENYARPIQIVIDGEDEETTGIANLDDKASASQNDKVFTLDGRQVNNTDNLPSGMYIVNGKKVVKK